MTLNMIRHALKKVNLNVINLMEHLEEELILIIT